ncbi:MAG: trypsin-like peptidase domain-containing protein [Eubacteriales bacterium]|nr:trypsin-like peptidase domain-containing protein [Eubacteriales bacterium]
MKKEFENSNIEYEPNFVMQNSPNNDAKDRNPESDGDEASSALYRDPRDGFTSASWTGGQAGSKNHPGSAFEYSKNGRDSAKEQNFGDDEKNGFPSRDRKHKALGEKKPSRPITLTKKTLALILAAFLVFSCLFGLAGAYIGNQLWGSPGYTTVATTNDKGVTTSGYTLEDATGSNLTIQQITAKDQASVVEIKTEYATNDNWMQQFVTQGAGSGVIISKDGYIVTNNHVIEGANKIIVTTIDNKSYDASLIGTDTTNDVAVIKIKAVGLTPVKYGNSDQLKVGDLAVAIGNPLGELGGTVTAGIISATDRELTIDGKTMHLLQTDSSINPGNSGGGLFNGDGQLIGLVVAKSSGSDVEGLGFAIPVNKAADVAQQLMDKGFVSGQPWTGMTYTEGSSGLDSLFGGSSGTVYIYSVDTNTARLSGFEAGDVVFSVDGQQITSINDLTGIITSHEVGDKLKFTIVRNGETMDLTLKLQEKDKSVQ